MSDAKKPTFLADSFIAFPLIESEQARIAKLAEVGGIPAHIIKIYSPETKPYQDVFQKKEKIPGGYRPGTPAYNKLATARLIGYLSKPQNLNYKFFWDIYKYSVLRFIDVEIPRIKALLSEVSCDELILDTRIFLERVCRNACEFGVTEENVKTIYELYWFPRVEEIESILPLCKTQDEQGANSRKLKRVAGQVESIEKKQQNIENQISTLLDELRRANSEFSELRTDMDSMLQKTNSIPEEFFLLKGMIQDQENSIRQELSKSLSSFTTRLKAIESTVSKSNQFGELRSDLKKLVASFQGEQKTAISALEEKLERTLNEKFEELQSAFESKIIGLRKEIDRQKSEKPTAQLNFPLLNSHPQLFAPLKVEFQIKDEVSFVNSWMAVINSTKNAGATFDQLLAHHTLISASKVAIFSEMTVLDAWLKVTGWHSRAHHIVASPVWATESDWKEGVQFLLSTQAEGPRILIIHDFNVAMAECYLSPWLKQWHIIGTNEGAVKIFLVPSEHTNPIPHQILEFAPIISAADFSSSRRLVLDDIRIPHEVRGKIPIGVDPQLFIQWSTKEKTFEFDYQLLQNALGLTFSTQAQQSFEKCVRGARRYFNEQSAIGIGMANLLLPWVKQRHGESSFSALGELLKNILNVRC